MERETHTKLIEGRMFNVTPFTFFTARKVELTVSALLKPIASELLVILQGTGKAQKEEIDIDTLDIGSEAISKILDGLFSSLTIEKMTELFKMIFSGTTVTIKSETGDQQISIVEEGDFDKAFGVGYSILIPAIAFVVGVNYPGLLQRMSGFGQQMKEMVSSKLEGSN